MRDKELFYWHGNKILEKELLSCDKVTEVKIATAYFSTEGMHIIEKIKEKYKLDSKRIKVYLSPEFSIQQPERLLEQLSKLCQVYIVYDIRFHPKVYFLKGSSNNTLLFGSSNLTRGGFEDNLEFDMITELGNEQKKKVDMFFDYCQQRAKNVDDEIIETYKANTKLFKELEKQNKKIKKALYAYANKDDAFDEDDYDLSNRYFKYEDYETLFVRNQYLKDSTIMQRRKNVQDKMLAIHEYVEETLKKKGLHCHWRPMNITSLITPCPFNKGRC